MKEKQPRNTINHVKSIKSRIICKLMAFVVGRWVLGMLLVNGDWTEVLKKEFEFFWGTVERGS